ncbi:flavin reductase family protein [Streptomyces sp. CA-288835]|uniref:flavin reductase family protein n=1 Tax=Streptomyces sp. CA-288835 TaxID=3240069 RepID=UPI003D944900
MNRSTPAATAPGGGQADDPGRFRHVLGHYPTGVTVVTATAPDDTLVGMVIGSFTSVSLDPPLVAFFAGRSSTTWPRIMAGGAFCVNVLAAGQEDLCRDVSAKAPDVFDRHPWRSAASGSPVLAGVVAWIDCDIADVWTLGDHYFVLGRVRELGVEKAGAAPLVFSRGRLAPLPPHRDHDDSTDYTWPDWL